MNEKKDEKLVSSVELRGSSQNSREVPQLVKDLLEIIPAINELHSRVTWLEIEANPKNLNERVSMLEEQLVPEMHKHPRKVMDTLRDLRQENKILAEELAGAQRYNKDLIRANNKLLDKIGPLQQENKRLLLENKDLIKTAARLEQDGQELKEQLEEAEHGIKDLKAVILKIYSNEQLDPDYDRLLTLIYQGTGHQVSFHNMEPEVKAIIKNWYERCQTHLQTGQPAGCPGCENSEYISRGSIYLCYSGTTEVCDPAEIEHGCPEWVLKNREEKHD